MTTKRSKHFSLKFFRVIWEDINQGTSAALLAPRVNRQLSRATERNRIKRVLREFFRKHPNYFNRGRWIFIAKHIVEGVPNREVFEDLEKLLDKVSN